MVEGLGADAAGGDVDDAVEGECGGGVVHKAQIGEGVFDLAAFVEAGCADEAVAQVAMDAGFLKGTTLGVCAVDDGGRAGAHPWLGGEPGHLIEHVIGFFGVVKGFVDGNFEASALVCAKVFGRAVGVFGDDGVCDIEDVLSAAVVLLEEDDAGGRVVATKAKDVAIVGAAEAVDGLVLVSDDKEVAFAVRRADEMGCQLVLGGVCILKLIYKDVAPLVLVFAPDFLVVAQEENRVHQQVIEIHGVVEAEFPLVTVVDASADFLYISVGADEIRCKEVVFSSCRFGRARRAG